MMRKLMKLLAIAGLCLPTACAQMVWVKDGATSADFDHDKAVCSYQAQLATPTLYYGPGLANALSASLDESMRQNQLTASCLKASGYQLERIQDAPAQNSLPTEVYTQNVHCRVRPDGFRSSYVIYVDDDKECLNAGGEVIR